MSFYELWKKLDKEKLEKKLAQQRAKNDNGPCPGCASHCGPTCIQLRKDLYPKKNSKTKKAT
jgi:hypothetical protein